jgi:hypothetical protein
MYKIGRNVCLFSHVTVVSVTVTRSHVTVMLVTVTRSPVTVMSVTVTRLFKLFDKGIQLHSVPVFCSTLFLTAVELISQLL